MLSVLFGSTILLVTTTSSSTATESPETILCFEVSLSVYKEICYLSVKEERGLKRYTENCNSEFGVVDSLSL